MARRQFLQIAVLLGAVYLLTAYGAYLAFTTRIPSGNDFFSRWMGGRALLLEGKDPYSEEVTLQIQLGMYGRPQAADKDQVAFAYPLYVIFTFLPLIPLSYAQAQALWMAALVYLVLGTVIITLQSIGDKPQGLALAALALGSVLFYPAGRGIILGQFAILVLFLLTLAWWSIRRGQDGAAGALLALSTIKPQMVIFVILFILLWAAVHKRWRIIIGFSLSMLGLFIASTLLLPDWLPKFLQAVADYQAYTSYYTGNRSPIGLGIAALFPGAEYWPTIILSLALAGYTLFTWYRALGDGVSRLWQAVGVTSVATLLIPIQTGSTNQVLLLWPLLFWLSRWEKHGWGRHFAAAVLGALLVVLPWAFFLNTVVGYKEHPLMALPIPLFALWAFSLGWPTATPTEMRPTHE